ncbi:type II secretion system F family protein, partial [Candidatus Peregrinibacteria bacterium]|nr:type II secretion system F family protein [Candidatus Peregrinibacteria bacterium]
MKKEEKSSDFQQHLKYSIRNIGFRKELYIFIENLTSLISAGMGLSEALSSLTEEIKSRRLKAIIAQLQNDIEAGTSLAVALEELHILPDRMTSLIRLGELSGKLNENLQVLVLQNEKDRMFRSKVRSSLTYTAIIFSFTIIVGFVTSWFVLPKLTEVFSEVGADLPIVTRMLIGLGVFIGEYGYFLVPLFILALLIAFYFLFSFPKTRFVGHSLLFKLPIIKNLIKEVEIARFGFLFGTMLKAGLPIDDAMSALPGITTFSNYKKFYQYLMEHISEGNSFQKSLNDYPKIKKL